MATAYHKGRRYLWLLVLPLAVVCLLWGSPQGIRNVTPEEPGENYPEMQFLWQQEQQEAAEYDAFFEATIASYDVNRDDRIDYVVRIYSFLYGKSGYRWKIALADPSGSWQVTDLGIHPFFTLKIDCNGSPFFPTPTVGPPA